MNKIKSVNTVLYTPTILELNHGFMYLLNELNKFNRGSFTLPFCILFHFTNSLPRKLIDIAI